MLLTPPLDAPDAPGHLAYAAYLAEGGGLVTLQEAAEISHEMVQQPPLYYALAALFDHNGSMALALQYAPENPYIVDCVGHKTTVLLPDMPSLAQIGFLIPRLLSLLGGLLAVAGCWLWLARALPEKKGKPHPAAFGAALLLGLTPMFAYESAAITNDILTVGLAVCAVVLGMASYRDNRWWQWLAAGALAGCAALTKYSGLLAIVPLGVIWLWHLSEDRSWRAAKPALLMIGGFAAVAGWWFVRNMALYGELVPMTTLEPLLPGLIRTDNLTLSALFAQFGSTWRSFFGIYACGIAAPEWLMWGWAGLSLAGLVGLVVGILRKKLDKRRWIVVSSSSAWLIASLLMMAVWANSLLYTDQGRLLFIAAPAFYALVALGWDCLIDTSHKLGRIALIAWLIISLVFSGVQLYAVYGPVETLAAVAADYPVEVTLDSGIRIVGVDMPEGAALSTPGELPITIYLSADQQINAFYTLYVQLVLDDDTRVYSWSGLASNGRLTTIEWPVGEIITLDLNLSVDEPIDDLATLVIGAYPEGELEQSETVRAARVRLLDETALTGWDDNIAPLVTWDNGIALLEAEPLLSDDGSLLGATLHWGAQQNITTDYTVSLQVLGADNQLLAQRDQAPQNGIYPTSTWTTGLHLEETYTYDQAVEDWQQLIVLLYDAQGQRLMVNGSDYYVIASR